MLPLKTIPAILNPLMNKPQEIDLPQTKKFSDLFNTLSIKEIKSLREELMVLKEQSFMIQTMIDAAKTQRKFDEVTTLEGNLKELHDRATEIQGKLGSEGFE